VNTNFETGSTFAIPRNFNKKTVITGIIEALSIFMFFQAQNANLFSELFNMESFSFVDAFQLLFPYSVQSVAIFFSVCLAVLVSFTASKTNIADRISSLLFALFMTAGFSIITTDAFFENMYSSRFILFAAVYYIGCYFLMLTVFRYLKRLFVFIGTASKAKALPKFFDHTFRNCTILYFLCWLPYILLRFPAGFEYDGYHQIARFMSGNVTAHWPPASTAFMGIFVFLGDRLFGSTNLGIFVLVLVQSLIGALIFAYCTDTLKKLGVPSIWIIVSTIVFAVVPIYPGYITSVVKDTMFTCFVVLYLCILARLIYLGETQKQLIALFLTAFAVTIFRNNGIYLVCGCIIFAIVGLIKKKSMLIIPLIIAAVFYFIYSAAFLPALGIKKGSEAEALSVPFQQTARVVSMHSDELSSEDIEKISAVLDYDVLLSDYEAFLSDPVKKTYHAEGDALSKYLGSWFSLFFKYPDSYFDAFISTGIGFYYPDARMGTPDATSGVYTMLWNDKDVTFSEPAMLTGFKPKFKIFIRVIENLPLIFPFVNIAIQCWIPICLFFCSIKRKDGKQFLLLIPSILTILICLAGPTYMNNGGRYALPVVYSNMLLMGLMCFKSDKGDTI
jgi:hypothetical protein